MMASSFEAVRTFFEIQHYSSLLYYFISSSPSLTLEKPVPKELLLPTNLNNYLLLKIQVLGKDKPLKRRGSYPPVAILSHLPYDGHSPRLYHSLCCRSGTEAKLECTNLEKKSKEKRKPSSFNAMISRKQYTNPGYLHCQNSECDYKVLPGSTLHVT